MSFDAPLTADRGVRGVYAASQDHAPAQGHGTRPASAPAIDAALFRRVFREVANGVAVVTTGEGPERTGLTATSATPLSADPATVLVCVNRNASSYGVIERTGAFAVSWLRASQRPVAERFAGKEGIQGADRYQEAAWKRLVSGASLLTDALASLDCVVEEIIPRHSHAIIIGRVVAASPGLGGAALIYWRGAFESLGWDQEEAARASGL